MTTHHASEQSGFTVLELMIATAVFSIVLLIVAAGILSFTKQYIKGITSSNTQSVARAVMADVVQNVQFSGGTIAPNDTLDPAQLCVGNVAYYYVIGQKVTPTQHGMVKDIGSCSATGISFASLNANQHEMLAENMRITEFQVEPAGDNGANISVTIASGDDDLLIDDSGTPASDSSIVWSEVHCKPGSGSQFCGVSHLTTFVQSRIQ